VRLYLAFGRRFALGLDAWVNPLEPVITFKLSHDGFLSFVVLAVAGDAAVKADTVGQDVDVLVFGIVVPGDNELVLLEVHAVHVTLSYLSPLLIREFFAGGGR
jgi:hypothetical protein